MSTPERNSWLITLQLRAICHHASQPVQVILIAQSHFSICYTWNGSYHYWDFFFIRCDERAVIWLIVVSISTHVLSDGVNLSFCVCECGLDSFSNIKTIFHQCYFFLVSVSYNQQTTDFGFLLVFVCTAVNGTPQQRAEIIIIIVIFKGKWSWGL